MKKTLILLAGCLLGASAFASCYTVMDAKGKTVSESPNPPVDMARRLHETVPDKYGSGATMIFGIADTDCGQQADTWDDGTAQKAADTTTAKKTKKSKRAARPHRKPQAEQQQQPTQQK
ncbi:MAG: hypothetical protein LBI48_00560 [Burkholderiaceae bacterium]|nr:hypothetical protein [Burkholderiaceae bacterium]